MKGKGMTSRERFLGALKGDETDRPCVGNPTSIATVDLMEATGCFFPEAHADAEKMARLAAAGHDMLGFDTIAPYFSVVQEAAALGARVDWGSRERMPAVRPFPDGRYLFEQPEEIRIPGDFLDRLPVRTVLEAIRLLRRQYGGKAAIVGKVFGPWTLSYHLFGIEPFLVLVKEDPGRLRRILERLMEVTLIFGKAQIEAGADCLTLADHLTGDLCRPESYRDFLLPIHQRLRRELPCPIILHICGYTLDRLGYICDSGFDAFHLDSKNDVRKAVEMTRGRLVLAGNVNNPETLYRGREAEVDREVREALEAGIAVVGPECAVPLTVESRHLRRIAEAAGREELRD